MKKLFGLFGTSKVMTLNAYTLIMYIVSATGSAMGFFSFLIPPKMLAIIIAVNVILSEVLHYFFPSGVFIGTGSDWTVGRWIVNLLLVAVAFLQAQDVVQYIPEAWLAFIVPVEQMIMKIFGGASSRQIEATKK